MKLDETKFCAFFFCAVAWQEHNWSCFASSVCTQGFDMECKWTQLKLKTRKSYYKYNHEHQITCKPFEIAFLFLAHYEINFIVTISAYDITLIKLCDKKHSKMLELFLIILLFECFSVNCCSTYYQIKIDERTTEHVLSKQFFLLMNTMVWSKKI